MPNFRYRALTRTGEIVSGSMSAPDIAEVAHRIEYLGLIPIETIAADRRHGDFALRVGLFNAPRREDVTVFTGDLALLLQSRRAPRRCAGASCRRRGHRPAASDRREDPHRRAGRRKLRRCHRVTIRRCFRPIYVALVRVGESSGKLAHILEVLGTERVRAEALRRKLTDALHYPAFVLLAASACWIFRHFRAAAILRGAARLRRQDRFDHQCVLRLSDFLRGHGAELGIAALAIVIGGWLVLRVPSVRSPSSRKCRACPASRRCSTSIGPPCSAATSAVLLGSEVTLTATLRILADIMATTGRSAAWNATVDRVRHGGKLSDALAATAILPRDGHSHAAARRRNWSTADARRQRIAEFYEAKLQRSLDRLVGIVGPLAIV